MESLILKAVMEITRQRDMHSLELSLITTLAEIAPVSAISLYKSHKESQAELVEEVAQLCMPANEKNGKNYILSKEKRVVPANKHLLQCLQSASIVSHKTHDGITRLHYPVFLDNKVTGALCLDSQRDLSAWRTLIETMVRIYSNYLTILNESERDKLTGLLNRRTFDYKLDKLLEAQRSRQATETLSGNEQRHLEPGSSAWLGMLDIDHFKRINDTYGHLFGDEVILMLSQKMRYFFRNSDLLFRFGGEEFVAILEPIPLEMAKKTFDRFSQAIAAHEFPQIGKITISIGYARITETDYPQVILERADKALYYAKESGRNCVFNYDELLATGKLLERETRGSTDLF